MQVIEVTKNGGPDVLAVVEKPTPNPGPDQVLIKVAASGVNFADLMARSGTYPPAPPPPFTPGFEVAGVIETLGDSVEGLHVGQRAVAMVPFAGYAAYAVADKKQTSPLPDALGFPESTALLVQGLTAYGLLSHAVPTIAGKTVLVSAAAGGVGSLAVQLAKLLGAGVVIGLASTDEKRAKVKALGADFAIDYTQDGWADEVKKVTNGAGADVFLDASGDNANGGLKTLARGGHWIIYGAQNDDEVGLTGRGLTGLIFGAQTIRGYSLYEMTPEEMADALQKLAAWAVEKRLEIIVTDQFPLSQAADAHRAIEARQTTGKVVLTS